MRVKKKQLFQQGLTLIELLVVISLIAILALSVSPFLSNFLQMNSLETTTNEVSSVFRKAQQQAMDNRADQTWGVCQTGSVLRLYSGSCGSPVIKEDFTIPNVITISGLSDVTFNKDGEPSSTLNITISSDLNSRNIELNAAGRINKLN